MQRIVYLLLILAGIVGILIAVKPTPTRKTQVDRELNALGSLGYLGGYKPAKEHEEPLSVPSTKAAPGYTLITSGHAPAAYLIDQSGKVIHTWSREFEKIFPGFQIEKRNRKRDLPGYWRHATILPDGSILAIFEGLGIVKLDKNSNVVWALQNGAHHDLQVLQDGEILLLTRTPEIISGKAILNEYLTYVGSDGVEHKKISILKSVLASPEGKKILGKRNIRGDLLHVNSVQVLEESAAAKMPGLEAGDVLISMRNLNALGIIRPSTGVLVWTYRETFKMQHFARIDSKSERLFLFDNSGAVKQSRVLIYSWPEMKLLRQIGSEELHTEMLSKSLGAVQELSNGNFLIVDSEDGRLYEVDSEGEIVWKYSTPHRTGRNNRLVATIPHAARISEEAVDGFLD